MSRPAVPATSPTSPADKWISRAVVAIVAALAGLADAPATSMRAGIAHLLPATPASPHYYKPCEARPPPRPDLRESARLLKVCTAALLIFSLFRWSSGLSARRAR